MIRVKEHLVKDSYIKNKDICILDLGACLGEFTNALNRHYKIKKAVLVEANPYNFEKITTSHNMLKINKVASVRPAEDFISFNIDTASPYNGSTDFNYFKNTLEKKEIQTICIYKLLDMFDYIDILKIDIEGSEYDILEKIDIESLKKVRQITVEFHDFVDPSLKSRNRPIEDKFISNGFKVKKMSTDYMHGSEYYDTLFYQPY